MGMKKTRFNARVKENNRDAEVPTHTKNIKRKINPQNNR